MVKKIRKILRIYMIRKKHRVTFEYLKILERRIKKQKNNYSNLKNDIKKISLTIESL